jgi:hypothetical protein
MQQAEVHKHTIETAVFEWEFLSVTLPVSNLWKHWLRNHEPCFRTNQFLWEPRPIVSLSLTRSRGPHAISKTNISAETFASAKVAVFHV